MSSQEESCDPWDDFFYVFMKDARKHDWSDRRLFSKMRRSLNDNNFYLEIGGEWHHANAVVRDVLRLEKDLTISNQLVKEISAEKEQLRHCAERSQMVNNFCTKFKVLSPA